VANLRLFVVGLYPSTQLWQPGLSLLLISFLAGGSALAGSGTIRQFCLLLLAVLMGIAAAIPGVSRGIMLGAVLAMGLGCGLRWGWPRLGKVWGIGWLLSLPIVVVLLHGVSAMGMPPVATTQWGGLMLTLLLAAVGIVAAFPLGLALALGRQSTLPVIRWSSIAYIELVRGVPLVSVIMIFSLLLPLFLPPSVGRPDTLLRVVVGITLFMAAYVAEYVRGGLQAIPRGQYEAATALGLTWFQSMRDIILPQALRAVLPALVGQCIALFKDTSLVTIVGLLELLGVAKSVIEQPAWKGVPGGVVFEVFVFTAMIYFVFTFSMAYASRRLEAALGLGVR
jgi:general L-amino acid transport system permease protein